MRTVFMYDGASLCHVNRRRLPASFFCRSQIIVLPTLKQQNPSTNANLKLALGLIRLAFVNGLGCFSIGKTVTCDLQKKPQISHY